MVVVGQDDWETATELLKRNIGEFMNHYWKSAKPYDSSIILRYPSLVFTPIGVFLVIFHYLLFNPHFNYLITSVQRSQLTTASTAPVENSSQTFTRNFSRKNSRPIFRSEIFAPVQVIRCQCFDNATINIGLKLPFFGLFASHCLALRLSAGGKRQSHWVGKGFRKLRLCSRRNSPG